MDNVKNVNLQVANFAMKCVCSAIDNKDINNKEYKTLVKKMCILIQKNGLVNTLAFNLSKVDKAHHFEVIKNIISWTNEDYKLTKISEKLYKNDIEFRDVQSYYDEKKRKALTKRNKEIISEFIKNLTNTSISGNEGSELSTVEYRLLTKEMMILFTWMKRFVDGMIEGE